jgi:hypothetical protein
MSDTLEDLRHIARLSNVLAKQLTGEARTLAYRIKAEACSSLVISGKATLNSVCPGGLLGLDLPGNPPLRIHVKRSHLTQQARARIDRMSDRTTTWFG